MPAMESAIEAAQMLATLRKSGETIAELPGHCKPASLEEGYAIQRAFLEHWPDDLVGWKVGATSPASQQLFGVTAPIYGPFFKGDVFESPAAIPNGHLVHKIVECEYVFLLSQDFPPRAAPYQASELRRGIGAVAPAFELVSPRFDAIPKGDAPSTIADCAINGGIVLGELKQEWTDDELSSQEVILNVDGKCVAQGSGADVLGHPMNALLWQINALSEAGLTARAGQFIATGTTTGVTIVRQGEACEADFGTLGRVQARFV